MKINYLFLIALFLASQKPEILRGQQPIVSDEWNIVARNIDPSKYFGVTVANGMIGIVSSPNPMQVVVAYRIS
jgi:protein-glucosylgalactosylhydroxylysine glucosidase